MKLAFITYFQGGYVNTLNGEIIDPNSTLEKERLERRNGVKIFDKVIEDNTFYKYSVIPYKDELQLIVYRGNYNWNIKWEKIYMVTVSTKNNVLKEEGDCDLDFWHEFFGSCYGMTNYDENYVSMFSMDDDSMLNVRKVFPLQLQKNPFLFLKKYRTLKRYKKREFDTNIFNIPPVKINKMVGKMFNGSTINYALQREIELNGEIFFDITVLTGPVENGIIDIKEKHRFFITKNYAYSPDGGDLGIFVLKNTVGTIYDTKMKRKYPEMMLDKYNGNYFFQYLFSKEFIPVFEILAKAGYQELADLFLEEYYEQEEYYNGNKNYYYKNSLNSINLYGKNDKEIFGFKLNKFKNIKKDVYCEKHDRYSKINFSEFISKMRTINKYASYALDVPKIDYYLFDFIYQNSNTNNPLDMKAVEYLLSIGTFNESLYMDYIRMCKQTNKYSGGLYPKNLKYEHDVMISYMNQLREAKNNKQFEKVVDSNEYKELIFEGKNYCILAPRTANDLVNESYYLHHCVRSYISDVALGRTAIYFLRNTENKSKPLVTIEVKRKEVTQTRGKYNRLITPDEYCFISEWCKEKNITISPYCTM